MFSIPELLETICLQMRIKDLLVNSQRVNRAWRDTIQGSRKLQQALFFESITDRPLRQYGLNNVGWMRGRAAASDTFDVVVLRNPLYDHFRKATTRKLRTHNISGREWPRDGVFLLTKKEASWRRMFAMQPPLKEPNGVCTNARSDGVWMCKTLMLLPERGSTCRQP